MLLRSFHFIVQVDLSNVKDFVQNMVKKNHFMKILQGKYIRQVLDFIFLKLKLTVNNHECYFNIRAKYGSC